MAESRDSKCNEGGGFSETTSDDCEGALRDQNLPDRLNLLEVPWIFFHKALLREPASSTSVGKARASIATARYFDEEAKMAAYRPWLCLFHSS